ncbi:MAG: hypothetical protein K8T10_17470 [Candidatus Eremiobacteraeota bacterium]|nr:hypothetical protein [Candidatus Eremiobacteraeota bacterium]
MIGKNTMKNIINKTRSEGCPLLVGILIIILFTFIFTSFYCSQAFAQGKPPASPSKIETHFTAPTGAPPVQSTPDKKTGNFERPQQAPRRDSQLMNSNTTYPQSEARRVLIILGILAVIGFYWLFLRGKMKKIIPAFGTLSGKIKSIAESSPDEKAVASVRATVAIKNQDIIRDMVIELEQKEKEELERFRSFSLKRGLPPLPRTEVLGIEQGGSGLHIILIDSYRAAYPVVMNLLSSCSRIDMPLLFFSSRISGEDIARGVMAIEMGKPWDDMGEQEKYRITRQVEGFMEKYSGIQTGKSCMIDEKSLRDLITNLKTHGKPTAVIIDDFSYLIVGNINNVVNELKLLSHKEGVPVFIIDSKQNKSNWTEELSRGVKSFIELDESENEGITVNDLLHDKNAIRKLNIEPNTGKLITS